MTIYTVNLDNLTERITLQIIDIILELESLGIKDESKYGNLTIYVFNAKITYDIILYAGEKFKGEDIPFIDTITNIGNNVREDKITEKEGWLQIKALIDKAGQLIKVSGITFDIDLEIIKKEITDTIIDTIEKYDTKIEDKAGAYLHFRRAIDGISDVYTALSQSLDLSVEERNIPLLLDILFIIDVESEHTINEEEAWNLMKDKIKIDLMGINIERYKDAIAKFIPWLKEQIDKSSDKTIRIKTDSIKKDLGPEFEKETNETIYLGLKAALIQEGIVVNRGKSIKREDLLVMIKVK